jgi:alginate O-acetyltransferase complex protein AlgJ
MGKTGKFFRILLAAVFCTVILVPGTLMLFGERKAYSPTEKRMLQEYPPYPSSVAGVSEFTEKLNGYLEDHFGLREFLVHRYQREVRKRFDVIGAEADVLKGLENYYYYTRFSMLDDFLGRTQPDEGEMRQWVAHYRDKERWLAAQNIQYLLVAAPSKYAVYPEYVAAQWREIRGVSRLQRLTEYLEDVEAPSFADLSGELLKAKEGEYLFHKSDTHWTPYGAYLGYLGIAKALQKKLPELQFRRDFTFSRETFRDCDPKANRCGDLTQMLLDFEPFREPYRNVDPYRVCSRKKSLSITVSKLDPSPDRRPFETFCREKKYTAVVFHDSFFLSIRPYFAENFGRVVYLWKNYDQANIEEILKVFKPDIVIEERFERRLFEGVFD